MNKSFTSFAGSEVALALLFPMESLFESYIAVLLKKHLTPLGYSVSAQDKTYYLFDEPKRFAMRPDIVIRRKADGAIIIMDTKWKLLADNKANYGIAQADMYQMYAYQKKYGAQNVALLYPQTDKISSNANIKYCSDDHVSVRINLIDLYNAQDFITNIVHNLEFA